MNRAITISREYGSGGREIGEKLARRLGIPFYDKELITLEWFVTTSAILPNCSSNFLNTFARVSFELAISESRLSDMVLATTSNFTAMELLVRIIGLSCSSS